MQSIRFSSASVTRWLFIALGVLLVLHLFVAFGHLVLHIRLEAMTQLVDLDLEANLPTLFNVLLFVMGSALFLLHGKAAEPKARRGWFVMAGVFLFLSLDEGSQIHEKFMLITLKLMNHGSTSGHFGWLYQAWVIPYGLAIIVLGLVLLRWFLRLPPKLQRGLFISGCVYVFGAVFLEMAGGKVIESLTLPIKPPSLYPWMPCEVYPDPFYCWIYMEPRYIALYTMEEMGEMTGLIMCIRVLLKAFETKRMEVRLSLSELDADTSAV